jgi:agmatinase
MLRAVSSFDPDAAAAPGSGLYGLPQDPGSARVHVHGVPFDATTSYRPGARFGPDAVLAASRQVDLHDRLFGEPFAAGICYLGDDGTIARWNTDARRLAEPVIAAGGAPPGDALVVPVDALGARLNARVRELVEATLDAGKLPCVLGGDHAVPFGAIAACAARHPGLGVLHFDAHADLRPAYEGFVWSHASIFHNVLEHVGDVARVVQVGVRDLGAVESARIAEDGRLVTLFDDEWSARRMSGAGLAPLVDAHLAHLPPDVYVSFDVDGLDPTLCPHTGTPVPGGLDWAAAMLWLQRLVSSGRRVVGLDLCEVATPPGGDPEGLGWDAIVGARLLYRLIGAALATRA